MRKVDINKGDRFGDVEVISEPYQVLDSKKDKIRYVDIKCHRCGNTKPMRASYAVRAKACGCIKFEKDENAATKHPAYRVLVDILARCYNENCGVYRHYGGRGITVCDEWNPKITRDAYRNFIAWANDNGWERGLSIDRIDVDGRYEPSNCRWITMHEQQCNRRDSVIITAFGETKNLQYWGDDPRCAVKKSVFLSRMSTHGWDFYEAFTTPSLSGRPKSVREGKHKKHQIENSNDELPRP